MAYKKKYRPGDIILTLDEVLKQQFVYHQGKILHIGWVRSWQLSFAAEQVKAGRLRYAVKNEDVSNEKQ